MLVLTRKVGQRVMIGDDIIITVQSIGMGEAKRVRLGFSAPDDVKILREELYEQDNQKGMDR